MGPEDSLATPPVPHTQLLGMENGTLPQCPCQWTLVLLWVVPLMPQHEAFPHVFCFIPPTV